MVPFFVGLTGGLIGAYVGWDSLKNRFEDNSQKELVKEKISLHDSTLNKMTSKESIIELGNRAIANGDREAYLKLVHIVRNEGKERTLASSEIARIKTHHYSMTSINGIKIERYNKNNKLTSEDDLKTEELINILLLDSQFLFRARSAQILSKRNENFVHEVLLLSIFSDNNIQVLRESTKAFEELTGFKSRNFFQPYHCLDYWYENSTKVIKNVQKINKISIIPFQQWEERISRNVDNLDSDEMVYWWRTSVELEQMLIKKHKIENPNNNPNNKQAIIEYLKRRRGQALP